jgi:hypothetical protein
MVATCKICSTQAEHETYRCGEKMFQKGVSFDYFQCGNCGCLQISEPPADLAPYYSDNYYSFKSAFLPVHGLKARLAASRDLAVITGSGWLGKLVNRFHPVSAQVSVFRQLGLQRRFGDFGCGMWERKPIANLAPGRVEGIARCGPIFIR